jgi:HK97 family phage major capsid protein
MDKEVLEAVVQKSIDATKGIIEKQKQQSEDRMNTVESTLKSLDLKFDEVIKSNTKPEKTQSEMTIKEVLLSKKDSLKSLKENSSESIVINKALLTTSVLPTSAGNNVMSLTSHDSSIAPIRRTAPFISQLFTSVPTTSEFLTYAEMVQPTGGAGMTAEGALKSEADFKIKESKTDVKKVTVYIKASKESLDDIDGLVGIINNELSTLVELKADKGVLSGDGLGDNLNGVINQATAFVAGDFATSITAANQYDVLSCALTQIETAEVIVGEPAGFMGNVIVLNPIDARKMKLKKNTTNEYVFPDAMIDVNSIDGIKIVTSARFPKGKFLVMDASKGNIRVREAMNITIGYVNDDFIKNMVTIVGEKRLGFYIRTQDVKAFVYGDFATATALITV